LIQRVGNVFEFIFSAIGFILFLPVAAFVFPPFPGLLIFALPLLVILAPYFLFQWIVGLFR